MSRLAETFQHLRATGRKALIPYITAGDPGPGHTVRLLHALVEAGADVLELGVPFSDPGADGPVIQLACERALRGGTGLWQVLDMVFEFRRRNTRTPIVLMGYLNPVETRGLAEFAQRARSAGVDGVLLVDLAAEEAGPYVPALRAQGLDCIFLLAPTTTPERVRLIAGMASGYLYYVSLKGVTGAAQLDVADVTRRLGAIRAATSLPVAVGFGIRDAASARAVGAVADGVVVGSALVSQIERHQDEPARLPEILAATLAPMRAALDDLARPAAVQ
jgi:tryptophan synthase alpha chain